MVLKKLSNIGKNLLKKKGGEAAQPATPRLPVGNLSSRMTKSPATGVEVFRPGDHTDRKPRTEEPAHSTAENKAPREDQEDRPRRPRRRPARKPAEDAQPAQDQQEPNTSAPREDSRTPESGDGERKPRRRRRRRPSGRNRSGQAEGSTVDTAPSAESAETSSGAEPGTEENRDTSTRERRPPRSRSRSRRGRSDSQEDSVPSEVRTERRAAEEHGDWDPASFTVEPREGSTRFADLDVPSEVLHGIADLGFQYCTPIQAGILPTTLQGKDAAGRAQTGTGKTAAFLVTVFAHLLRHPPEESRAGQPRVLILGPTRELVLQIEKEAREIGKYVPAEIIAVFGGMDFEKQKQRLQSAVVDVMVATPGRLIDFMRRNVIDLGKVEILVIDEADRMLDMGFIPDVKQIVYSTPPKQKRQTLLFSATLDEAVTRLAASWTTEQNLVEIEPESVAVNTVEQVVYITTMEEKFTLLYNLLKKADGRPVMVFGNRRDITQDLTDKLKAYGFSTELLSGAVNQTRRLKVLDDFKSGKIEVLVATDVAGRGIHVDGVAYVINYNLPQDPEDYVHRIGRTGRAGNTGTSISFACEEESFAIPAIEAYIKNDLRCTHPEDEILVEPPQLSEEEQARLDEHRKQRIHRSRQARDGGGDRRHRRPGSRSRQGGSRSGHVRGGKPRRG